jgi:hypothetical protein
MTSDESSGAENIELAKPSTTQAVARERAGARPPITFHDIRSLCPWPGCSRAPQVRVEYAAPEPEALRVAPGIRLGARGGLVDVCIGHAIELGESLGPGRIRALRSLV